MTQESKAPKGYLLAAKEGHHLTFDRLDYFHPEFSGRECYLKAIALPGKTAGIESVFRPKSIITMPY